MLKTDASDVGIGAILTQCEHGLEPVIAYGSRKLNSADQNYRVPEREALAVVWRVHHFCPYLLRTAICCSNGSSAIEVSPNHERP